MYNIIKTSSLVTVLFLLVATSTYAQTAEDYFDAGKLKYEKAEYRGAIQDYSKAIELDPANGNAYYNRGFEKGSLGQIDSACLDLSKAGELGYFEAYEAIKENCN